MVRKSIIYDAANLDVDDISYLVDHELPRIIQLFEQGEHKTTLGELEQVFQSAARDEEDLKKYYSAALLVYNLVLHEDNQGAFKWLDSIKSATSFRVHLPCSTYISSLWTLIRAYASTKEIMKELVETKARLSDDIHSLDLEIKDIAQRLFIALREEILHPAKAKKPRALAIQKQTHQPSLTLNVNFLGQFKVSLDTGVLVKPCSNRKGHAILQILLSTPHSRVHKESLLSLLWCDEDPAVASGKLHIAVSRLRRSLRRAGLGNDAISFERDCYCLNERIRVVSDLPLFDSHFSAGRRLAAMGEADLAAAEFEAAKALYNAPFLADVVGEDWLFQERARIEEQVLILNSKLADWHYGKGRYEESAICCQGILERDSLREDIYRTWMRSLSRQGKRNQALRLYHDCEQVLMQELGVEPMKETRRLAAMIENEDPI